MSDERRFELLTEDAEGVARDVDFCMEHQS
jgi:hypothetical protein